jgi:hypothetical protein
MAERDHIVPVWNRMIGRWEPVEFRNGQHVLAWPHGFRHELLPIPEYQEGDHVQFVRDETCAREGVVRLVLLQGALPHFRDEQGESISWPHLDADDIIYIVTARGHDHRIKAAQVLGRFVSLERISRILPPQE